MRSKLGRIRIKVAFQRRIRIRLFLTAESGFFSKVGSGSTPNGFRNPSYNVVLTGWWGLFKFSSCFDFFLNIYYQFNWRLGSMVICIYIIYIYIHISGLMGYINIHTYIIKKWYIQNIYIGGLMEYISQKVATCSLWTV